MANIDTWVRMGRPKVKTWRNGKYVYTLPVSSDRTSWMCDTVAERQATIQDRTTWYQLKPGCKAGYRATEGLAYSESAAGFIGTGMKQPADAVHLTPAIPAPEAVSPQVSTTNFLGAGPMIHDAGYTQSSLDLASQLGKVGSVVASLTPSVCKGPYNRQGTMCVPKSDCKIRDPSDPCVAYSLIGAAVDAGIGAITGTGPGATGITDPGYGGSGITSVDPCPTGYKWDGSQCVATGITGWVQQTLPGGQTGTGSDVYGMAVIGAYGRPALQPYVETRAVRRCPPGTVLGGDGLCYDKIANKDRMWPRGPRPLMTGGDMKILRRAEVLKKKVKRLASSSGFTCRKR